MRIYSFVFFFFPTQFIVVLIIIQCSDFIPVTNAYPFQYADTPIQKISIRPPTGAQPLPLDRSAKNAEVSAINSDKSPSMIVIIEKKPKLMAKVPRHVVMMGDIGKRRPKFHVADGAYPVYYAIARANGSFRNHPIRTIKSE